MNSPKDNRFSAEPGVPTPEKMAMAMFPPSGIVTTPPSLPENINHLHALRDGILSRFRDIYRLDAIVHSGLHTSWKDLQNKEKRDIDGQHIPHEVVYQTSRSWYVICAGCKSRGKFFVLAECFFRKSKSGTKNVEVKKVFFHDSVCQDHSVTSYPNSCCLTKFSFDDIIGTTYDNAISILNQIDITKSTDSSPYPKTGAHINGGNSEYLIDNRQYIPLPDTELGVDQLAHYNSIWRLLYYHVSIHNLSMELASPMPFFVFNSLEERKKKHGHLTVDQVTCIFGQQDLRYNWITDPPPKECYPDPADGGEVCQVPHVDCPTGESRELREIMFQHGHDIRCMPGTIIVPLHDDGREVYGQSPKLNLVKIPKGSYLSFDGDWVHGGVSRKPPNKQMCPALHIHIDSYYMGRRKDRLDLDTRDIDRAIYLPKEHLPFRNLVSLMRVMQKRSRELGETILPIRDRVRQLEDQLLANENSPENMDPNLQKDTDDDSDVDSEDDEAYHANKKMIRSTMYHVYLEQITITNELAAMVAENGKPLHDTDDSFLEMNLRTRQALFARASKAAKAAAKAANASSRNNGRTTKKKNSLQSNTKTTTIHATNDSLHETAQSMVMLHGTSQAIPNPTIGSTNESSSVTVPTPKRKCTSKKDKTSSVEESHSQKNNTKKTKKKQIPSSECESLDDSDNSLHSGDPTMI